MMNNNKILTVSYGTFSCTLEGFEDSFGTMKVIAEYFRDLAADDRYFGAEPPQPDADMLARIAQNEVSRRVEAREQDGKIVLSALAGTTVAGAATARAAAIEEDAEELTLDAQDDVIAEETSDIEEIAFDDSPVEAVSTDDAADDADDTEDTATIVEDVDDIAEVATTHETDDAEDLTAEQVKVEEVAPQVETAELDEAVEDETATSDFVDIEEVAPEADSVELEEDTAEVDETEVAETEVAEDAEPDMTADQETADAVAAEYDPEETDTAFIEDENDIVPGQPDEDVSAFFANNPSKGIPVAAPVAAASQEALSEAAPAPNSIAAKLQRIRAVVAQNEERGTSADYAEDEHADGASEVNKDRPAVEAEFDDESDLEKPEVVTDALADIEDALDIDEARDAASETDDEFAEDDTDDLDAILSRIDAQADDESDEDIAADELDEASLDDAIENAVDEGKAAEPLGNIFDEDDSSLESDDDSTAETEEDMAEKAAAMYAANVAADDETAASRTKSRIVTRRMTTRVIKVKRADLEAAIEKGDLEEYDTPSQAEAESAESAQGLNDLAPAKSTETALSPEQQDDLARELAELEEDIARDDAKELLKEPKTAKGIAPVVDEEKPRRVVTSRGLLPNLDDKGDAAVNRLLVETDHQMDEPESATRRDAFAHLRAAVAAKKADSSINGNGSAADSDDVYREDLAEVVRPRRPLSGPPQTERPSEPRPAPLKLVAEQRVQAEETRNEGPVQPRRVAAVVEHAPETEDESEFAEYAAEVGATTLPQLLEAAAAFLCYVEGRDQFSRPQLMTKVREAGGPDGFSREDGLRSFGQLLRAGKIEKMKGGRFTVSDDIGYRPDERAAG
jgi:hypothetical protein